MSPQTESTHSAACSRPLDEAALAQLNEKLRTAAPRLEMRTEEPMSQHTTFRVGGPAALMVLPATEEETAAVLQTAYELGVQPFFLGNGSNLLVSDAGYRGLVVKLSGELDACRRDGNCLTLGGGMLLSRAAAAALEYGLTGLEFASGIPGTVGGGITMNAGAYGGELKHVISRVRVMHLDGTVQENPNSQCEFSYRHSAFLGGDQLILSCTAALQPGSPEEIRATMDDLNQRRREKQPLEFPSAGSTFKRPKGYYAAALIDQCGLKGLSVGGAQVSEKHAGFVINRGGATCADVLALMEQVQEEVLRRTGVKLEPEVRILSN